MPLVVERRRGHDADRVVERREARARLRRLRLAPPADRLLERRPLAVGAERRAKFPWRVPREQLLALGEKPSAEHRAHPKKLPSA